MVSGQGSASIKREETKMHNLVHQQEIKILVCHRTSATPFAWAEPVDGVAMGMCSEALHDHTAFTCAVHDEDGILDVISYIRRHNNSISR